MTGDLFDDVRGDELLNVGLPEQHAPTDLDVGQVPGPQVPIKGHPGNVQDLENLGECQQHDFRHSPSLTEASPDKNSS